MGEKSAAGCGAARIGRVITVEIAAKWMWLGRMSPGSNAPGTKNETVGQIEGAQGIPEEPCFPRCKQAWDKDAAAIRRCAWRSSPAPSAAAAATGLPRITGCEEKKGRRQADPQLRCFDWLIQKRKQPLMPSPNAHRGTADAERPAENILEAPRTVLERRRRSCGPFGHASCSASIPLSWQSGIRMRLRSSHENRALFHRRRTRAAVNPHAA